VATVATSQVKARSRLEAETTNRGAARHLLSRPSDQVAFLLLEERMLHLELGYAPATEESIIPKTRTVRTRTGVVGANVVGANQERATGTSGPSASRPVRHRVGTSSSRSPRRARRAFHG